MNDNNFAYSMGVLVLTIVASHPRYLRRLIPFSLQIKVLIDPNIPCQVMRQMKTKQHFILRINSHDSQLANEISRICYE